MIISFAELGLNEQILAGVEDLGFAEPTPVQEQAIPYVLAGRDVVASAQTGTGKTAAFTLPTLQLIAALASERERDASVSAAEAPDAANADTSEGTVLDANPAITETNEPSAQAAAEHVGMTRVDAAQTDAEAVEAPRAGTESADAMQADARPSDTQAADTEPSDKVPAVTELPDVAIAGAAQADVALADAVLSDAVQADAAQLNVAPADAEASDTTPADATPTDATQPDVAPADAEPTDVTPADGGPADGPQDSEEKAPRKRRRRRRRRKRPAEGASPIEVQPSEEEAIQPEDASPDEPTEDQPADEAGPHKRRRRRRRRKKTASPDIAATDSATAAAADPQTGTTTIAAPAADDTPATATAAEPPADAAGTAPAPQPGEPASTPRPKRRRRRRKKDADSAPFVVPETPSAPLALVVTPTRELAQQIERVASVVCSHTGQRAVIVMGGARFENQIKQLQRGCDLLVATPGRLIDLMERSIVDLSQVRILVLDEADRMLDMGFWPSVRRIVQALPSERQNLLFSATIPPSIKGTLDAMLDDPATVEIARIGETADTVEEHLCPVTQGQKTQLLRALVEHDQPERVLVFCRTKHRTDDVSKTLKAAGLKVEVMHADRPQKARDKALERFREGSVQLLVATDVMSRGIDVSGIDAVVNYDVPMDPEDYVHRIGRTGRAGHTGHAYTFVAPDEISPLREIEYFTHKLVPVWDLEGFSYDAGRIVPNPGRSTEKPMRTMFSGSRARNRGPRGGRFGRHY